MPFELMSHVTRPDDGSKIPIRTWLPPRSGKRSFLHAPTPVQTTPSARAPKPPTTVYKPLVLD